MSDKIAYAITEEMAHDHIRPIAVFLDKAKADKMADNLNSKPENQYISYWVDEIPLNPEV